MNLLNKDLKTFEKISFMTISLRCWRKAKAFLIWMNEEKKMKQQTKKNK